MIDIVKFGEDYKAGLSFKEIAKKYNVRYNYVYTNVNKYFDLSSHPHFNYYADIFEAVVDNGGSIDLARKTVHTLEFFDCGSDERVIDLLDKFEIHGNVLEPKRKYKHRYTFKNRFGVKQFNILSKIMEERNGNR